MSILKNNNNFCFSKIFIKNLYESGLHKYYKFYPIGTSEDNNIYVGNEYYDLLANCCIKYNEKNDQFCIIVS